MDRSVASSLRTSLMMIKKGTNSSSASSPLQYLKQAARISSSLTAMSWLNAVSWSWSSIGSSIMVLGCVWLLIGKVGRATLRRDGGHVSPGLRTKILRRRRCNPLALGSRRLNHRASLSYNPSLDHKAHPGSGSQPNTCRRSRSGIGMRLKEFWPFVAGRLRGP